MAYGRLLRELARYASLALIAVCSCMPLVARVATREQIPSAKLPIPPPDIKAFLPARALLVKRLTIGFDHDGRPGSIVLAYTVQNENDPNRYDAGIRVMQYSPASGWAVAYEEHNGVENGGGDALTVDTVKSLSGQEGVVVILEDSGAGTSTAWHIIATDKGKFLVLDPTPIRDSVLKKRAYIFMGYNGVTVKGDIVTEQVSGHSQSAPACCPDRPSIDVNVKFTGTSIKLDSVKQLPLAQLTH
jgi:hypothetical protein